MDTPETLAADMLKAAGEAIVATRTVVQVGAFNVKRDARANVLKSAPIHNAGAAAAITYDTTVHATSIDAEIGYDKDRKPGRMGNLLEYGGGGDHSPPHRDLGRALDNEAPKFEAAIATAAGRLL